MKKIFFDFDDVLLDTRSFKQAHVDVFVRHGISQEIYLETYDAARERSGALNYQFETHMQILGERVEFDEDALRAEIRNFTDQTYKYVFPDVQEGLQILADAGYVLYLVTFGTPGWQDRKVAGSGIDTFFEEVVVGEIDKGSEIAERIAEGDEAWFVDDRAEYLMQAERACSGVTSVLMQRPEGRFSDAEVVTIDHRAESFGDIIAIIRGDARYE